MSFIRCFSNPEGLYVWSDGRSVNISHGVKRPHSSGRPFTIPDRIFRRCIKKWLDWRDPAVYRGMRVEEIWVHPGSGKLIPEDRPCKRCKKVRGGGWYPCRRCARKLFNGKPRWLCVRLSYRQDFVHLWGVTWAYVAAHERDG